MRNVFAVCVVIISVAFAAAQTQSDHDQDGANVIVREGHRVVVVEYDENGHHNTKVSISPLENADDSDHTRSGRGGPNLVCDAYGKCKQKIMNVFGKSDDGRSSDDDLPGKEAAKDRVYSSQVTAEGGAHKIRDAAENALHKAKDRAYEAEEAVKDRAYEAEEAVKDRAYDAEEAVKDRAYDAEEAVKDRAYDAEEAVKDGAYKIRDAAENALHKAKDRAYDGAYKVREAAEEAVKGGAHKVSDAVENSVHRAKDRVYDAKEAVKEKAYDATLALNHVMTIIGLLGFATALGTSVWVSFVSSYVLGRAMGRQQFGVVQSKVYPVYFKVMGCCIGAALLGHVSRHWKRLANSTEMYQAYDLLGSLLVVLANFYLIEPRATKAMFERMKLQKEEGRGVVESQTTTNPPITSAVTRASVQTPTRETVEDRLARDRLDEANKKLKRYNTSSYMLNMMSLVGLIWHMVYLSQLLVKCST